MPAAPLISLSAPYSVGMIWAQARGGAIGADGELPWHIPEDLAHFKAVTNGLPVLHGRRSYEALPEQFRPLPGRRNLVLTREQGYLAPGAEVVHSIEEATELLGGQPFWIAGGGQVYTAAMHLADVLVITDVDLEVPGDTFAPQIDQQTWVPVQRSTWVTSRRGPRFRVTEYRRRS